MLSGALLKCPYSFHCSSVVKLPDLESIDASRVINGSNLQLWLLVMQVAMEISRDFIRIAFSLVLLMVIHNFLLNNFCILLAFLRWLRVPGADGSKAAMTNLWYFRSYLAAIAESLLLAQLKAIRSSPCLAVLLDGSTDVSNEEHALIYLRYFDNITLLPLTCFLFAVKLPGKAGVVVDGVVRKVFQVLDLPFHKVVALSTDGDAAMIGQHNGFRAFFLKTNPWLISTHCAAHKTALVMADVSKRFAIILQIDKVLRSVYNFFGRSGKKQKAWKQYAGPRGCTRLKFPIFNTTRWFSRADCIMVLLANLPILIKFLERYRLRSGWEGAAELYVALSQAEFIFMLHAMADIMQPIEHLRLYFQRDNAQLHCIKEQVDQCKSQLYMLLADDVHPGGTHLRGLLRRITRSYVWCPKENIAIPLQGTHRSFASTTQVPMQEFIEALIAHIDERFPEVDVLTAFAIFDPEVYVGKTQRQLADFGSKEIIVILKHLQLSCAGYEGEKWFPVTSSMVLEIVHQFVLAKNALWLAAQATSPPSMAKFWADYKRKIGSIGMPYIVQLAELALVIPVNTACCERGFSTYNIIKTKLRNQLKIMQIDCLMRVKFLSKLGYEQAKSFDPMLPLNQFDYQAASEVFVDSSKGLIARLAQEVSGLDVANEEDFAPIEVDDPASDSEATISDDEFFGYESEPEREREREFH